MALKIKCPAPRKDGTQCTHWAMDTGFCKAHDPNEILKKEIVRLQGDETALLQLKGAALQRKQEQLIAMRDKFQEKKISDLEEVIGLIKTIDDPESLRQVELEIMSLMVQDKIDPKAGAPLLGFCRHQAELLGIKKVSEGVKRDPSLRNNMMEKAKDMSGEDAFALISDLAAGIKRLEQKAIERMEEGETITVEAQIQPSALLAAPPTTHDDEETF